MTTTLAIWNHTRVAGVLGGSTSGCIAETFSFVLDASRVQQVPGLVGVVAFSSNCQTISRNSLCTTVHPAPFVRMKVASWLQSFWSTCTCHEYMCVRTAGWAVRLCVVMDTNMNQGCQGTFKGQKSLQEEDSQDKGRQGNS